MPMTMSRMPAVALATALSMAVPWRAMGQESPNPNQAEITRMQHQIDLLEQRAALVQQQAALEEQRGTLWTQRMNQLGLTNDATGKTELEDGGGQFEGWLLSASAVDQAAQTIAEELGRFDASTPARPIMLLTGDEPFDLSLPRAMAQRLSALRTRAEGALAEAGCAVSRPQGPGPAALPAMALPLLGTLIGSLRTDTQISGFDGPTDARLVVSALARHASGRNWILPGSIAGLDPARTSGIEQNWREVSELRPLLGACRRSLQTRRPAPDPRHAANLDAAATEISAFETQNVLASPSMLIQAARLEHYSTDPNVRVLRVYLGKAGGSLLVRRNLWTALGAPAVGVTGGANVEWRRINPFSGQVEAGGSLNCVTELSNMRRIQAGESRRPRCVAQLDSSVAATGRTARSGQ